MTIGPCQATGSSIGLPETSRNRMPSSPAWTVISSPESNSTSERLPASSGVPVAAPTHSVRTARGADAARNVPLPSTTSANAARAGSTGPDQSTHRVAQAVTVLYRPVEDVGDGFDPAMGVPRKSGEVVLRVVVAEVVQQEERVELARVPEPERSAQPHARALDGGLRLSD